MAADGRVLVSDREHDRIQIFTPDGQYLNEWTGLSRPTSLFIDRAGLVYVTEVGWEFDPGGDFNSELPVRVSVLDGKGGVVARWESAAGGGLGNFTAPHGICVDSRGDLYLASNNGWRRADPSSSWWTYTPEAVVMKSGRTELTDSASSWWTYSLQKFVRET